MTPNVFLIYLVVEPSRFKVTGPNTTKNEYFFLVLVGCFCSKVCRGGPRS